MKPKIIDLSTFQVEPSKERIRQIFFRDEELRFVFMLLNNNQPVTLPELENQYNKLWMTQYSKSWVSGKLRKLNNFGLFEKRPVYECNENGNAIEVTILTKYREWAKTRPVQFRKRFETTEYYSLTEKGLEWVNDVEKIQKKEGKVN